MTGTTPVNRVVVVELAHVAVRIDAALVRRLPLAVSVREEAEQGQDRFPSRVAERALADHVDAYAASVAARYSAGLLPAPAEVVWMPKANLRYRPLSALPVAERAVLRALANELTRTVNDLDAYVDTHDFFRTQLLDDEREFTHFALADVGSFFRYVSHDLLHQRLVETTGRADLADTVSSFLHETMQAGVGLPQSIGSSDVYADLVIAPIERRLTRKGIPVARHNDDFRIAGMSDRAVRHGLEELQSELHAIGLTLNDAKTAILDRDAYAEHTSLVTAAERDEASWDDNSDVTGVLDQLRSALDRAPTGELRFRQSAPVDDARRALRRLIRGRDASAVRLGQAIINRHPSLTQIYSRYCATLVRAGHGDDVMQYLDWSFPRLVLGEWQELWLLEPLIARVQPVPDRLRAWLTSRLGPETPALLRSRAALAAAHAGLLDSDQASLIVDAVTEVARPDAILAFSLVNDGLPAAEQVLAGLPDPLLASWVYRH